MPRSGNETAAVSESLDRLARSRGLFREVNDRILAMAPSDDAVELLCECSDTECVSTAALSFDEYGRIRSNSAWFIVTPGHEVPAIERVIAEANGYAIVERMAGREFAKETDSDRVRTAVGRGESQERDEALRILYRLRALWDGRESSPPPALKRSKA
jgi:hypothetical protein